MHVEADAAGEAAGNKHCSQNITVDNRTNQDLNLTIKYDTEPLERDPTDVQSRIMVPRGATMSHVLYSESRSHGHGGESSKEHSTAAIDRERYSHLHQTPPPIRIEPPKVERKFQPLSHHPAQSHIITRPVTTHIPASHVPIHAPLHGSTEQLVRVHAPIREVHYVPSPPRPTFIRAPSTEIRTISPPRSPDKDSEGSSIKEELHSRTVVEGNLVRTQHAFPAVGPTPVRFNYSGHPQPVPVQVPIHVSTVPATPPPTKVVRVVETTASPPHVRHYSPVHTNEFAHTIVPSPVDESRKRIESTRLSYEPQVYNYISDMYHKTLPAEEAVYTFSDIKESHVKHRAADDWKVEPIDPLHYYLKPSSPKAVPEQPKKERTEFKKKLQESRDKRIRERMITEPVNRHSVDKQYYHALPDKTFYQISHSKAEETKKRDDLFDERKQSYLKELESRMHRTNKLRKELTSYKKVHHSKHCSICHPYNASVEKTTSVKKRSMSPKAQQVTERLYNRSKKKS